MTTLPGNRVARISPLVPGVDLAGTVVASDHPPSRSALPSSSTATTSVSAGTAARRAGPRPGDWVVPRPAGLSTRHAMVIGTAGSTALLSLRRLEQAGLTPADGPCSSPGRRGVSAAWRSLVLARHGYGVVASTGKPDEHDYLRRLGATSVVGRDVLAVAEGPRLRHPDAGPARSTASAGRRCRRPPDPPLRRRGGRQRLDGRPRLGHDGLPVHRPGRRPARRRHGGDAVGRAGLWATVADEGTSCSTPWSTVRSGSTT